MLDCDVVVKQGMPPLGIPIQGQYRPPRHALPFTTLSPSSSAKSRRFGGKERATPRAIAGVRFGMRASKANLDQITRALPRPDDR
jgi:hypothetical protein